MIDDDLEDEAIECPIQYICVIDFEATCLEHNDKDFYPHEIIEFPAVLINTQACSIVSVVVLILILNIYECIYQPMCVYIYICLYLSISIYIYIYGHKHIYKHTYTCIYT